VHICRRWRRIVLASQQALHIQLFLTLGTPVLKTLDCWPALPIVVQYGGSTALDQPAPEDGDNIVAALKQSDRVSSISLTVTSSLLDKLSAIERPFSQLEDLVLLSQDSVPLTLPNAFRWGSRLRSLHLTGITFPSPLRLLYSSRNLVDLQLHELYPQHFSQETLTNALSGMAQLRSLSLHFVFTTDYIGVLSPSSGKRLVLPALTRLKFRGITKYLEGLVARIDAPRLGDIEVTFLNEHNFDLSELSGFIDRIEMHKLHRRAHFLFSELAVCISLVQLGGAPTCIKLQVFCEQLSEQLYSMARICIDFSAVLSNVEDLRISVTRQSNWGDVMGWLMLINSFTGVKWLYVSENISTDIVTALQVPNRWGKTPLPALHRLFISISESQPGPRPVHLSEANASFMTSRRLSGHHIRVEYELLRHIDDLHGTGTSHVQCQHHYSLIRLK
jgi:hypothetical protein